MQVNLIIIIIILYIYIYIYIYIYSLEIEIIIYKQHSQISKQYKISFINSKIVRTHKDSKQMRNMHKQAINSFSHI
jgi:hypothetical protein